jgi:hypothetical protein
LFQDGSECDDEGFGCGDCRGCADSDAPAEQEQGVVDDVIRREPCPTELQPADSGRRQGEASFSLRFGELAEDDEIIDGDMRDVGGPVVAIGGR